MGTFVHRAMVLLGFSDEEEEMEVPVYSGDRRYESEYRSAEPESRRFESEGRHSEHDHRRQEPERRVQEQPRQTMKYEMAEVMHEQPRAQQSRVQVFPVAEQSAGSRGYGQSESGQAVDFDRTQVIRPLSREQSKLHIAFPSKFSDVQDIGDRMKLAQPVIVNLEGIDKDLHRRIVDFCSGVTYSLDGKMKRVAGQVFLLTPSNVEVAQEEVEGLAQRSLFGRGQS